MSKNTRLPSAMPRQLFNMLSVGFVGPPPKQDRSSSTFPGHPISQSGWSTACCGAGLPPTFNQIAKAHSRDKAKEDLEGYLKQFPNDRLARLPGQSGTPETVDVGPEPSN